MGEFGAGDRRPYLADRKEEQPLGVDADAEEIPELNPLPYEQEVCRAFGLLHPTELENHPDRRWYHHIGELSIVGNPVALDVVIREYHHIGLYRTSVLRYREYVKACKQIERIKKAIDDPMVRVGSNETYFAERYSYEVFTEDQSGYISYLTTIDRTFHHLVCRRIPVYIDMRQFQTNAYVLATIKSGKSELLKVLLNWQVQSKEPGAIVALDPAGEFVEAVAHWPEFVGTDKLVYLQPNLQHGQTLTINPFEIYGYAATDYSDQALTKKAIIAEQLAGALEEIIARHGGQGAGLTVNMRAILMPCLLVLLDRPGSTLRDLQRFMQGEDECGDLLAFASTLTHHPDALSFFRTGFMSNHYKGTKMSIYTKLQSLLGVGVFADLTCGRSTVEFEREVEAGKIILVNLSQEKTPPEQGRAFGCLLVAMLQGIAMRRAEIKDPGERMSTMLIADECHNFVTRSIESILFETRKYKLFAVLCQQNLGYKMSPDLQEAVVGVSNVMIAGRTMPAMRQKTSALFPIDADRLVDLRIGHFQMRMGDHPTFKVFVRSDLIDFSHRMSTSAWKRLQARQLRAFYRKVTRGQETEEGDVSAPGSPSEGQQEPSPKKRRQHI